MVSLASTSKIGRNNLICSKELNYVIGAKTIIAMTLNRYSHVTPDMQRSAADTLDAAFTMVS